MALPKFQASPPVLLLLLGGLWLGWEEEKGGRGISFPPPRESWHLLFTLWVEEDKVYSLSCASVRTPDFFSSCLEKSPTG